MNALIFPGQGSQLVGMGLEFYKNFKVVRDIFSQADDKLKFSLSKIILEGPENELQLTKNTQPAILTVSFSIYKILIKEFNFSLDTCKYFAGHSLGEYSALVCAGSLDFDDALYLLHERGKEMQNAVPVGQGSMIAVLGTEIKDIKNLIKESIESGVCEVANDNANGQVIISGDKETINSFQLFLGEKKIKSIPLKVSAPFHCSLMKPAATNMSKKINETNFKKPNFEIINNVNANSEEKPDQIKKLLIDQICSTVRWRESLIYMSSNGAKNFIEIGPGKVLSGMVKRTLKNCNSFAINSITDIKSLNDKLKK